MVRLKITDTEGGGGAWKIFGGTQKEKDIWRWRMIPMCTKKKGKKVDVKTPAQWHNLQYLGEAKR